MGAAGSPDSMDARSPSRAGSPPVKVAMVVWVLLVAAGMHSIWRYESTAGAADAAPPHWPLQSGIRPTGRATVVMLAHPYCSCTRASIAELAVLMSRLSDRVSAVVVFSMPGGDPDGWAASESWRSAAAIPGVTVMADPDGAESRRFHATTSGMVVAYDRAGDLVFQGGITSARGHEGDNAGRRRLTAALMGARADRPDSPVFGCALEDSEDARHRGTTP